VRYLITGATGFLGPYLVRRLASDGNECRCLVRSGSDTTKLEAYGAETVVGDITRPETLIRLADDVDCLLHMATLGHMNNFTVTEQMFEQINVKGTINIMTEALRVGVPKVVHCSSVAAMGICQDNPATEQSICNPHHPYGRSKLRAEKEVLRLVEEQGLPATIVRFSMIYGPGDPRDILKLTRMAKKGLWPTIGSRPKLTPLVHADDAVQGLLLAAEKGKSGEIYLITNQQSEPFDRLRRIILKGLGVWRPPIYVPEWAALGLASAVERSFSFVGKQPPVARKNIESTLADRVFSTEKAQRELGFEPTVDVEAGLEETVRWYLDNGSV
jgi:dihydroflavonol-4-reductase